MAMRESLMHIEAAQNDALKLQKRKELERKQKEAERKKKQQEKEELATLEYDVKDLIRKEFQKYIYQVGSNYAYHFELLERKQQILNDIIEQYPTGYKNYTIIEIFNKNYYKILKEVKAEKEADERASYWLKCEQQTIEEQTQKSLDILPIFKIICYVVCAPIVLLVAILMGTMKNSK